MNITIGVASDPGQKRSGQNQDSVGIVTPGWLNRRPILLLLADGMGGYSGGEIASKLVVKTMRDWYRSKKLKDNFLAVIEEAVYQAHKNIRNASKRDTRLAAMGSTVVAAILDWPDLHLLNVGDSRAYLTRDHKLEQISKDQSAVYEMVQSGEITVEEAMSHPQRNVLSMSISAARESVKCNTTSAAIQHGDCVLLCSDGLWSVVPEKEIIYFLDNFTPQEAADDLIKLANVYGGPDNVSVIVARYD